MTSTKGHVSCQFYVNLFNEIYSMKVVFITTSDVGGAGDAVYLNHRLLLENGIESKLLVKKKFRNDDSIIKFRGNLILTILNLFLSKVRDFFLIKEYLFYDIFNIKSSSRNKWLNDNISDDTDIIVLGWISTFVKLSDIVAIQKKTQAQVYIQAVDMALLTGGCHYSYGCDGYTKECFICPAAVNSIAQEEIKTRYIDDSHSIALMGVKVFSPVKYILNQAKCSSKPFSEYILAPLAIDFDIFHFQPKQNDEKVVFMGAYNPSTSRKGYLTFSNAISLLNSMLKNEKLTIKLLVPKDRDCSNLIHSNISLQTYDIVNTPQELAQIYQQSDVFVSTSIDDTGPAMVIESLLCGIPVISTETGVAHELLHENPSFGKIVPVQDSESLAKSLYDILFSNNLSIPPSLKIEQGIKDFYKDRKSLVDILLEDVNEK